MTALIAMPPLTFCTPLFSTKVPVAEPPESSISPWFTTAPLSLPPELTVSIPPLRTVVSVAAPPDDTVSVSPLLSVRPLLL